MTIKWRKTAHPGLRYYEHQTRKHGKRKDRYYAVHFKVAGKVYDYGIGWWSDGMPEEVRKADPNIGFEQYCLGQLKFYKTNIKDGSGARSPKEKRAAAEKKRTEEREAQEQADRESVSFGTFFTEKYKPVATSNKSKPSMDSENGLFKNWIDPVIGPLPLKDVSPIHLERIKKNMVDAGKAPSTTKYALALVRQVFNYARLIGDFTGDNPVTKVKKPAADNRRLRFLSHNEANALLAALKSRNQDIHDMALLSLHCGLRAGEIFSLTWGDVDADRGILTLRDTKSGKNRHNYMTEEIKAFFSQRERQSRNALVFPKKYNRKQERSKEPRKQVSKVFNEVVNLLNLNEGVTDRRQKVVWHTLRHTCASWLVESGVNLYVVKEVLGHSKLEMTERYSHLSQGALQNATKILEQSIQAAKTHEGEIVEINGGK